MPKIVDHKKYREELLLKCFDLFALRGYLSITMREIAKELNVSTGSLYHYFSNKQTMLQQMFEVIALREIEKATYFAYQTEQLDKRVDNFLNYMREREPFYKRVLLLFLDFSKHCTSEEDERFLYEYGEMIYQKISEGVGLDRSFGVFIWIFLAGLFYHRFIVPNSVDMDEQLALLKTMVMPYMNAHSDFFKEKTAAESKS